MPLGFDLFPGVVTEARDAVKDMAQTWVELLRADRRDVEDEPRDVA